MINGRTVQQSEVQNMFHSVQLNVNNPHFLIMQGRITKVLNMKPVEILGMIEEAAGTRMFETKKQAAIKTIEKKQLKVDELTNCMSQDITPTLESLRTERMQYQTWIQNNTEIEKLERFCVAHSFHVSEERVRSSENDRQAILDELEGFKKAEADMTNEAQGIQRQIEDAQSARDAESEGPLAQLKETENRLSKELVKLNTLLTNQKETLNTEKEAAASLGRQIESSQKAVTKKTADLEASQVQLAAKESDFDAAEKQSVTLRETYQNACAGVADENSAMLLSLPEQVATWEKRMREAESQLKQGTIRVDHAKTNLKDLTKAKATHQSSQEKTIKQMEAAQSKLAELEKQLAGVNYSEVEEGALRSENMELIKQVSSLRDQVNTSSAQLEARLGFSFKDPERGFDRSKVKGLVANLLRVTKPNTATALEIVGGGKLFQVAVDNEATAKLLLQKGGLKKRVTILPLNKIDNRTLDPAKVEAAKALARSRGCNAYLALELVRFDEDVRRAMEYTFGNTIICDNAAVAQEIAFAPNIRTKTVTLEGDSYDPSGTLTGGSNSSLGTLLVKIEEHAQNSEKLVSTELRLKEVSQALNQLEAIGLKAKDAAQALDLQKQAVKMCQDKMADSSYARTVGEIEARQAEIASIEQEAVTLKEQYKHAKDELVKLKDAESGAKSRREAAMKEIEGNMKAAQKKASALKTECTAAKAKCDTLTAELAALKQELTSLSEQVAISGKGVARLTTEIEKLTTESATCRTDYDAVKVSLAAKQAELTQYAKEIKVMELSKEKSLKAAQTASLEGRKVAHKLKQWEGESKDAVKKITQMLRLHPWIEKEKSFFGVAGSDFDFSSRDVGQSQKRLTQLKGDQERLVKKVNRKVMGMIEKAEAEYKDLSQKREVILKDKAKIEAVIDELDVKKTQALQTTWTKVNRDFGSIFSMLLPGTTAKLEPPEGHTASDGLEVKVAFNGVWKDSLTELSGGQRSLLALSLILALLLFKPAPMYILDEVDAALDLSHTQNIGLMLRTHFSTSQFIVVSLKEGMFNNANVIFRTRFVDGVSTVSRTVVGGKNRPQVASKENNTEDESEEVAPKKKKGKVIDSTHNASNRRQIDIDA